MGRGNHFGDFILFVRSVVSCVYVVGVPPIRIRDSRPKFINIIQLYHPGKI